MLQGTTADGLQANDSVNDTWVNMPPPPMASFPSSCVATLRRQQHLHGSVGSTHTPASGSHMSVAVLPLCVDSSICMVQLVLHTLLSMVHT